MTVLQIVGVVITGVGIVPALIGLVLGPITRRDIDAGFLWAAFGLTTTALGIALTMIGNAVAA